MRIVVKVGTSTLAYATGRLNIRHTEKLVEVLSDLKNEGHEVILVSSGAIGMGVGKLSLPTRPKDTSTKQACAAVGQCELMYTYDRLFNAYNHTVAQILLTGVDVEHTERRVNFQNTLSRLLDLGEQSFDTFRLDYYSQAKWPGRGVSPRENMELVYEVCLNYAEKFGRFYFKNLFLSGAPGLGKTFLSACIARTVSEHGFSVVYDTAGHIFERFEAQKFGRDEAERDVERVLNCDLLILDDLGAEFATAYSQSVLYQVINDRMTEGRATIISTNLDLPALSKAYNERILSRLIGSYTMLGFVGRDIRQQKLARRREGNA